jgi:hypothetical protein
MRRRTILAIAVVVFSSGGVALIARRRRPHPTEPELALLSPLRPGGLLAGWRVIEIQGIESGVLGVVVSKDDGLVQLIVGLASEDGPAAPASAGRFDVYYSARRTLPDEARSLANALADVLRNNQSVPTPPGLGRFHPGAKPGITL